jgi:hypothetical protein
MEKELQASLANLEYRLEEAVKVAKLKEPLVIRRTMSANMRKWPLYTMILLYARNFASNAKPFLAQVLILTWLALLPTPLWQAIKLMFLQKLMTT